MQKLTPDESRRQLQREHEKRSRLFRQEHRRQGFNQGVRAAAKVALDGWTIGRAVDNAKAFKEVKRIEQAIRGLLKPSSRPKTSPKKFRA